MTTAGDLARHYAELGLSTADTLPPRRSHADPWGSVLPPLHLTSEQQRIFKRVSPHALCLVGTDAPISAARWDAATGQPLNRIGDNRGVWPMRLAKTGSHRDTVTDSYNKSPVFVIGVQMRFWLPSDEHVKRLAAEIEELLRYLSEQAMGTPLINGFLDLGADLHLPTLEGEILSRAERHRWPCRTDAELVRWLEAIRREEQLLDEIEGRR